MSFSRGSSLLWDRTLVSRLAGRVFINSDTREAHGCGDTDINEHLALPASWLKP